MEEAEIDAQGEEGHLGLMGLPNTVLHSILASVDDAGSVINFATTCKAAREVGGPRLCRWCWQFLGPAC